MVKDENTYTITHIHTPKIQQKNPPARKALHGLDQFKNAISVVGQSSPDFLIHDHSWDSIDTFHF